MDAGKLTHTSGKPHQLLEYRQWEAFPQHCSSKFYRKDARFSPEKRKYWENKYFLSKLIQPRFKKKRVEQPEDPSLPCSVEEELGTVGDYA